MGIWVSTRSSTTEPWSQPLASTSTDLGDALAITTPVLSWDARTLFMGVVRPTDTGNIFVSTREKVTGKP